MHDEWLYASDEPKTNAGCAPVLFKHAWLLLGPNLGGNKADFVGASRCLEVKPSLDPAATCRGDEESNAELATCSGLRHAECHGSGYRKAQIKKCIWMPCKGLVRNL